MVFWFRHAEWMFGSSSKLPALNSTRMNDTSLCGSAGHGTLLVHLDKIGSKDVKNLVNSMRKYNHKLNDFDAFDDGPVFWVITENTKKNAIINEQNMTTLVHTSYTPIINQCDIILNLTTSNDLKFDEAFSTNLLLAGSENCSENHDEELRKHIFEADRKSVV